MSKNRFVVLSVVAIATLCWLSAAASAASASRHERRAAERTATEFSPQDRPAAPRRARTRIEVRPLPGPLHRECVPVFEERWIPQWGGNVLYASQRCWWARG